MKIAIPYVLVIVRLAIALCFIPAAILHFTPVYFAVLLIVGLLTDFFVTLESVHSPSKGGASL